MAGKTRKWTDIFFVLWLILAGVGIVFLSVSTLPVTVFGKSKDFGLVCLGLLDVLGILMLLTGRSDWRNERKKETGTCRSVSVPDFIFTWNSSLCNLLYCRQPVLFLGE